ncbi:MAG TPA: hypothetical protein VH302_11375 [Bryobacteraceae bacterium]|nr:hypothetical protein [Bryobacteraceae bacterium]
MKKSSIRPLRQAFFTAFALALGFTVSSSPALSQILLPSLWERPPQALAPDLSELKIIVISGEDGVNIVRKKTAVQPVVEVRDKNNLPVSGAVVNFITPNTGATGVFSNGTHTLTLVTDNAGRATVTGMHPAATGAFHIAVSAAVQGHVVATAVITQVNFVTAAAAAGAAGGSAAGASAAAGGAAAGGAVAGAGTAVGISAGVVAGIAGGVAAAATIAAVVATHIGGKSATINAGSATALTFGAPH